MIVVQLERKLAITIIISDDNNRYINALLKDIYSTYITEVHTD